MGSCSRAEYAMLPKGGSYHGVNRASTPVPAQARPTAAVAAAAPAAAVAPEAIAAAAPATTAAPAAPQAAKRQAAAQKQAAAPAAQAVASSSQAVATPAPKPNAFQRVALNKVTRKVDKLMQRAGTVRQHDNTASTSETSAISGNLRTGIILLLIGLIVGIFSNWVGGIIVLIGLIFIVLWLLDNL
ncbi:hypothetical protein ACFQT0_11510 [Hymenobacter humi]|uniref:Uncharacterized protein n=1 Tax=Hymenobacter humi TaxID=1411620 RepID=A0ABW2U6B9_9BACT